MQGKMTKIVTPQMLKFQMLNVIGNPYVHIFGVVFPIVLALLITQIAISELPGDEMVPMVTTSIYLGMGTIIPMAVLLMGYSISYAQELSKGIPERMQLFGIKKSVIFCNNMIVQTVFLIAAFVIFFLSGYIFSQLERPTISGLVIYILCMIVFSMICLSLAHGIACLCKNFGRTYCVSMLLYFAFMILGGMMGISYDNLPGWAQIAAKLLPVTYINRDFYQIWTGQQYHYMPMIQSFLFFGAVSAIILFLALKRPFGVYQKDEMM